MADVRAGTAHLRAAVRQAPIPGPGRVRPVDALRPSATRRPGDTVQVTIRGDLWVGTVGDDGRVTAWRLA